MQMAKVIEHRYSAIRKNEEQVRNENAKGKWQSLKTSQRAKRKNRNKKKNSQ
jgi:hypothetical protein